jgi:hypothetical protein
MINIFVTIETWRDTESEPETKDELLVLETLAAVSADDGKSKIVGRWSSKSRYLGSDLWGNYYVRNVRTSLTNEARWSGVRLPSNPIGFFFDSQRGEPFLVLAGIDPVRLTVGNGGDGRLLGTTATDVARSNVNWSVAAFNPAGRVEKIVYSPTRP